MAQWRSKWQDQSRDVGTWRASINWNTMRDAYKDFIPLIMDGQKVIVCKLKANPTNFTSLNPIDELIFRWFKELPDS